MDVSKYKIIENNDAKLYIHWNPKIYKTFSKESLLLLQTALASKTEMLEC